MKALSLAKNSPFRFVTGNPARIIRQVESTMDLNPDDNVAKDGDFWL